MPLIGIDKLIDKPLYATKKMSSFIMAKDPNKVGQVLVDANGLPLTKKYVTYKKGDLIGTLDSYLTTPRFSGLENKLVLIMKPTYGVNPYYVVATDVFDLATNKDTANEIKAAEAAAAAAAHPKSILEQYLDKYLPYVVGGVVVWLALPTVLNSFRSSGKKVGAMSGGQKAAAIAALIALLAFKKKSKNSVEVSPVIDTTDWSNPDAMTVSQQPRILPHVADVVYYNEYYNTNASIQGISKKTTAPFTC